MYTVLVYIPCFFIVRDCSFSSLCATSLVSLASVCMWESTTEKAIEIVLLTATYLHYMNRSLTSIALLAIVHANIRIHTSIMHMYVNTYYM